MAKSPRQALRDLANARGEAFEELFGLATGKIALAEHRALAIVGTALLEDVLRGAICCHLNIHRTEASDTQLFEDEHAPLQGVSARSRMAISLGIIHESLKQDIDTIRSIRIAFARSATRITFDHHIIVTKMNLLNTFKYFDFDYQNAVSRLAPDNVQAARFAVAVSLICGAISLHVPFWLPNRDIARALKTASLRIQDEPSPSDQASSGGPQ
jgi:hypothetical protein